MNSPCIKVCKVDYKTGLCIGCLRNLNEIRDWMYYDDDKRQQIMSTLHDRADRLFGDDE